MPVSALVSVIRFPCLGAIPAGGAVAGTRRIAGQGPRRSGDRWFGSAKSRWSTRRASRRSAAPPAERRREVLGQLALELEPSSPSTGCAKARRLGVQELALEPVAASRRRTAGRRRAGGRSPQVGADLVGAAGLQPDLEQRLAGQQLDDLEVGHRRTRAAPADDDPLRGDRWSRPSGASIVPVRDCGQPVDQREVARGRPRARRSSRSGPCGRSVAGRRPAARRCPCRAGGRSRAAPGPRRRRAARRAPRPGSARDCRAPGGRPGRPACRRPPGTRPPRRSGG